MVQPTENGTQANPDTRRYGFFWFFVWFFVTVICTFFTFLAGCCVTEDGANIVGLYAALLWLSFITLSFGIYQFKALSRTTTPESEPTFYDKWIKSLPVKKGFRASFIRGFILFVISASFGIGFVWAWRSVFWACIILYAFISFSFICLDYHWQKHRPSRVQLSRIFDIAHMAWLILIVSSIGLVVQWLIPLQEYIQDHNVLPHPFSPEYINPLISDFLRYLLVAAVVLFIANMFNKYQRMSEAVDMASQKIANNIPSLTDSANRATQQLNNALEMLSASGNVLGLKYVMEALNINAKTYDKSGPQVLANAYSTFINVLHNNYMSPIHKLIQKSAQNDKKEEMLFIMSVFEKYLHSDLFLLESGQDTSVIPLNELRTWFPHYAATVQRVTSQLVTLEQDTLGQDTLGQ